MAFEDPEDHELVHGADSPLARVEQAEVEDRRVRCRRRSWSAAGPRCEWSTSCRARRTRRRSVPCRGRPAEPARAEPGAGKFTPPRPCSAAHSSSRDGGVEIPEGQLREADVAIGLDRAEVGEPPVVHGAPDGGELLGLGGGTTLPRPSQSNGNGCPLRLSWKITPPATPSRSMSRSHACGSWCPSVPLFRRRPSQYSSENDRISIARLYCSTTTPANSSHCSRCFFGQ